MTPDLEAEMAAAQARWYTAMPGCLKHLVGLGLKLPTPENTHLDEPRWGLELIAPRDGGLYEPVALAGEGASAAPLTALILPLHDTDGVTLIDLLAWRSAGAGEDQGGEAAWWRRTGLAPMLGLPAAAVARWDERPITLQATPAAWLAAAGGGVCVLDWDHPDVDFLLRAVPAIEIAKGYDAFAHFVWRWLRRPVKRRFPDIIMTGGQEAVA